MAERLYHPGRRKRRIIMRERAIATVFGIIPEERHGRFPAEIRDLLEALIDADAAYGTCANKDRCIVAGEKALSKATNTVSELISRLEFLGFVRFETYAGGLRLVIADETLSAFIKLEKYEAMIDTVARIEDRGMAICDKTQSSIDELKNKGIYVGKTDDELDEMMRNVIEPVVQERQAARLAKKEAKKGMKKGEVIKYNGLKKASELVAGTFLAISALVGVADASSMADRGGTVGLTLTEIK